MRSVSIARRSALGTATISLALALAACGSGDGDGGSASSGKQASGEVSKAKIVETLDKELANDPELKGAFTEAKRKSYAECTADIIIKRGNKDDVKAWIAGKKKSDEIRGVDGDQTNDPDVEACAKNLE